MAITFSNSVVTITDGTYSFEDIYQEAVNQNKTDAIHKLEDTYVFEDDLIIGDKSTTTIVKDINISIVVKGDLLQVLRNATLQLGELSSSGSSINGCYIKAPNIKLVYGFGDIDKNDPGSFIAYDSKIDIFGFWSFFGGVDTKVIVKDCFVNGYGRIEGSQSILENINFKQSHGRYGILSPKGTLNSYKNLSVGISDTYTKNDIDYNASIYYNAAISGDMIVDGGTYRGYDNLIFCEKSAGTITLLDVDYDDSKPLRYIYYGNDNLNDLYIKYSLSMICLDHDENIIQSDVVITDNTGTEIFNGSTDVNGKFETQLTYGYCNNTSNDVTYYYPFNIKLTYTIDNEEIITNSMYSSGTPSFNVPVYLGSVSTGGGDGSTSCSCNDIDNLLSQLEDRLTTKLNSVESGVKQVVREVSDEVNENEVFIKETGFSVII